MNYQELQEAKQTFRLHTIEKEHKSVFKARENFVKRFNPDKIASMKIDEYVIGKQSKTSFCYEIERNLDRLGRITGQPSSKFGVWYSPNENDYKYESRLGNDYKEVFRKIKSYIIDLLDAGKNHNYDDIIANPLNALLKGKILSIYYPNEYLNIFSREHLDYYLRTLDLDTAELMKQDVLYKRNALLGFKNSDKDMKKWSNDMFSIFLWSHFPKSPAKSEEMAVKTKEEEYTFPTIENISFVNMELSGGKNVNTTKSHAGKPSPNYEKEARKYKKLGDRGEYIVMQAEEKRLMKELSMTAAKTKKQIKWVSRESDAFGYDILSVNKDKTPRYIEVKATQRKVGDVDFYYTENEYETAKKYGKNYYIYIVYDIMSANPKVWMLQNPFVSIEKVIMKPVKYRVEVKIKE